MPTGKLSPHFAWAEFECHDGTDVPVEVEPAVFRLATSLLEPIRLHAGCPLTVISGYRTPEYNKRIGGAKQSRHVTGEAADIRGTRNTSADELHRLILQLHASGRLPDLGGLGLYRTWVHVDLKRAGDTHLRQWNGKGVGSEQ
jgi:uncharacterized protein YcbK (DUF882 family)